MCGKLCLHPSLCVPQPRQSCLAAGDQRCLAVSGALSYLDQHNGGGVETTGAIEWVHAMLLQSRDGVLRLFPHLPETTRAARFVRLRTYGRTRRWVPCRIGALRVGACLHRVGAFLVTANYSAGAVESPVLVQSEAAQHCTMEVRTASMLSAGHFPPKLRPEQKRSVVSCQALAGWSTVHVCHGGREIAVGQSSEAGGGRLWRWPTAVGDYQVQRTACAAA